MNITLRKIEPTDLPFLYQWENDSSAWADGANHNPLSQADLRAYIDSTTGDIYRDGQLRLVICSEGKTLGCADLFDMDIRNRRAAMGLYIIPEVRGKGIGKTVVEALENYARVHLNLRLVYAVISENNSACSALYQHTGYTPSSKLPDWTLEGPAVIWTKTL